MFNWDILNKKDIKKDENRMPISVEGDHTYEELERNFGALKKMDREMKRRLIVLQSP